MKTTVAICLDTAVYEKLEAQREALRARTGYSLTRSAYYEAALRAYIKKEEGVQNE